MTKRILYSMMFYSEPTRFNYDRFKKSIELALIAGHMRPNEARYILNKAKEHYQEYGDDDEESSD